MAKASNTNHLRSIIRNAITRCENPDNLYYYLYGARGITVCEEWHIYENFYAWALENGYQKGLTLDRIDNDGDYCPENCRWVDMSTQANNKRNNVYIEIDGVVKTQNQWSREADISRGTIASWIKAYGKERAAERIKQVLNGERNCNKDATGVFVYCSDTHSCFDSIAQAAEYFHVTPRSISKYIDTGEAFKGHYFYSQKSITGCKDGKFVCVPCKEPPVNKTKKRVRRLTVNGTTKTAKEWSIEIGASPRMVSIWMTKHGEEYAVRKVAYALENGFADKYSVDNKKPVIHISSGTVFPSMTEASKQLGINPSTLRAKIKRGTEFAYCNKE